MAGTRVGKRVSGPDTDGPEPLWERPQEGAIGSANI